MEMSCSKLWEYSSQEFLSFVAQQQTLVDDKEMNRFNMSAAAAGEHCNLKRVNITAPIYKLK